MRWNELKWKEVKGPKPKRGRPKKSTQTTYYIILASDNNTYSKMRWVMLKQGICKSLSDSICKEECFKGTGGANSVITRVTMGGTDCQNCMYKVIAVNFPNDVNVVKISDVIP